jgi:hypothetical protein
LARDKEIARGLAGVRLLEELSHAGVRDKLERGILDLNLVGGEQGFGEE